MKIYEIEAGEKSPISKEVDEKIIRLLTTECSDAISSMQQAGKFLYRGIDFEAPTAFHGRTRENRKALHSSRYLQNDFNEIMTTYGFTTNRSNCIFCTGRKGQTNNYGYPYIIFPKNGFGLLWSPIITDLFGQGLGDAANQAVNSQNKLAAADAFVKKYQYTDSNLAQAIKSKNEIMISGEYYAFSAKPYNYTNKDRGHPDLETILSSVFKIPVVSSGYDD
jgi:hypothetical protein